LKRDDKGIRVTNADKSSEIPPRVEYSLTPKGLALLPILNEVMMWNDEYEVKEKKGASRSKLKA
jgi:DNA-binding HxlR family transcriptional regulator